LAPKDFSLYKGLQTIFRRKKQEGHLYLKLFYLYVYSVSAVVGNAIQFWVKIPLPETKQSCQGR
jgi:hypothetical protein